MKRYAVVVVEVDETALPANRLDVVVELAALEVRRRVDSERVRAVDWNPAIASLPNDDSPTEVRVFTGAAALDILDRGLPVLSYNR